jgi:hypothetical protein
VLGQNCTTNPRTATEKGVSGIHKVLMPNTDMEAKREKAIGAGFEEPARIEVAAIGLKTWEN